MRDLQECQAEVFRRSEQRIKARKHRRNCIVALCVPLVLCLAVAMTFRLARGENGSLDGFTGGASQENYESFSVSMDNVKVSGPDFSKIYTEPARVLQICEQLQAFSVRPPEDNQVGVCNADNGGVWRRFGIAAYGNSACRNHRIGSCCAMERSIYPYQRSLCRFEISRGANNKKRRAAAGLLFCQ